MAQEIKVTATLEVTKNGKALITAANGLLLNMSGKRMNHVVAQSIGFAAREAVGMGEITTPGWAIFVNRDATNFVTLFPNNTDPGMVKLKPGEPALFRLSAAAAAPYAQSDTAACDLEYLIVED